MKTRRSRLMTKFVVLAATTVFSVLAFASSTMAQGGRPEPPRLENERRIRDAQREVRAMEINIEKRDAMQAQANEEFKRIQMYHNEIMTALSSDKPLDYMQLAETATALKKSATWLKTNLVLPAVEKEEKQKKKDEAKEQNLKPALAVLAGLIRSFVANMNNSSDSKAAAQARLNLDEIIERSDRIKKSVEKLNKTGN